MVPTTITKLTGGLSYDDRHGTLVDWNLCFNANGKSTHRTFRSGTPAFMPPTLLGDEPLAHRTLAHDMESFFAVIIWMASYKHTDQAAFRSKPLGAVLLDKKKAPDDIVNAKENWFRPNRFQNRIVDYFEPAYRYDERFVQCIHNLCKILYPANSWDDGEEMQDVDPMKEGVFRECMEKIDDYLKETKGSTEMQLIDSTVAMSSARI